MVRLVADCCAIGQGRDRRPERGPAGRALAGGVLYRVGRVPNPEKFVESSLVSIHPRGTRILAHCGALKEPDLDIFGVTQVGYGGEVGTVDTGVSARTPC